MYIPNLASKTVFEKHESNIKEYELLKNRLNKIINKDVYNSELNNRSINDIVGKMNKLMDDIERFRCWYGDDLEFNEL